MSGLKHNDNMQSCNTQHMEEENMTTKNDVCSIIIIISFLSPCIPMLAPRRPLAVFRLALAPHVIFEHGTANQQAKSGTVPLCHWNHDKKPRLFRSTRIFFIKGQVRNFSTRVPYMSLDIQYSCPIRCPLFSSPNLV